MIQPPASPPPTPSFPPGELRRRALLLWPRLSRAALRRCGDDPKRISNLVARRTALPVEQIRRMLTHIGPSDDEIATWFG
jgi:hypothetical protein